MHSELANVEKLLPGLRTGQPCTAAYVGILAEGSTSRMRAECLRNLTPGWRWSWVDTDQPLKSTSRVWQSLAYRFYVGKAVRRINATVVSHIKPSTDLVWVDKAVFLEPGTMRYLRSATRRLIHFTPDTAFGLNRSRYFNASLPLFDLAVTTKTFDIKEYERRIPAAKLFLVTQGYDPAVHNPRAKAASKARRATFVGLAEPDREKCIRTLLESGVPVQLAGRGWSRFVERWARHPLLDFRGPDCFGSDYAEMISSAWVGLGLLSKRFPEQHTTRTFEIPACGTVLATESTTETSQFFSADEAIFFRSYSELASRLRLEFGRSDTSALEALAGAGRRRVKADSRDYPTILSNILRYPALGLDC